MQNKQVEIKKYWREAESEQRKSKYANFVESIERKWPGKLLTDVKDEIILRFRINTSSDVFIKEYVGSAAN